MAKTWQVVDIACRQVKPRRIHAVGLKNQQVSLHFCCQVIVPRIGEAASGRQTQAIEPARLKPASRLPLEGSKTPTSLEKEHA